MKLYIEIGDRKTRKTLGLVNEVATRLHNKKKSIIITPSSGMSDCIMERLSCHLRLGIFLPEWMLDFHIDPLFARCITYNSADARLRGCSLEDTRLFYDEFDFYIDKLPPWLVKVDGYYCSSLHKRQTEGECFHNLIERINGGN